MKLLERHFEMALAAPDGIKKLRELILTLAMQGKLVPQDPDDQPASELLKRIEVEKKRLIKEGKIKKQEPLPPIKPEEVPYALPAGWQWVRLETLCNIITQGPNPKYNCEYDVRYGALKTKDFYDDKILYNNITKISRKLFEDHKRFKLQNYDIIFGLVGKGSTAKCNIFLEQNEFECIFTRATGLIRLVDCNLVLPRIIHSFFLSSIGKAKAAEITDGSTGQLVIRTSELKKVFIPLPPLAEQKRIVAKVDELMAMCDKLEAERDARNKKRLALQKAAVEQLLTAVDKVDFDLAWEFVSRNFADLYSVSENVADLKKAILQLAVMGKLVPQDPSDQSASELLKQIEAEKKKLIKEGKIKKQEPLPPIKPEEVPYTLPAGWEWVRLGEILTKYGAGSTPLGGQKVYQESGIMFLRSQNVWNDGLKIDDVARIDQSIHEKMSGTKVEANDILLNITGASIGRSAIFPFGLDEANVSQHVAILRTVTVAIVEYLHLYIIAPVFQDEIMDKQVGVSREGLSMSKLKDFPIPLPPLSEQQRIVAKVDELMALCDRLEQHLKDATDKQTAILNAVVAGR